MNNTHKTIRVRATMETELYIDITVPIDMEENILGRAVRDDQLNSVPMWNWKTTDKQNTLKWPEHKLIDDMPFDPFAPDYSNEFLKYIDEEL